MVAVGNRGAHSWRKKSEILANVATIVVSVLLSVVLVKQFLIPRPARDINARRTPIAKGADLKGPLPGVDWAKNGRTLVLAISTQCHFCTESAPFFQRVAKEAGGNLKLLAVLPQSAVEARQYLDREGVRVDDVRQSPLESIGVSGTPTLLLVNGKGVVTDLWVGKVQPEQEDQVLAVLSNKGQMATN